MFEAGRRWGRLFLLLAIFGTTAFAQNPGTTTVQDTVYRADSSPAAGTLAISWPPFTAASGQSVAAGSLNVTLGANGALSVQLVPNASALPANTVYTVVYQLNDRTNKTEYWIVPTNSPATLAQVRTTLGAGSPTTQLATQQYVNTAVAAKANDNAVVHLNGAETITGIKQFAASPAFPSPVQPTDAANKTYVDQAVQNSGAGSYVSKAGDVMSGPLTLPGSPVSALQAATKGYVDTTAAAKADLVSGKVPTGELASGTANNSVCLHGDGTWSACGTSSNAISIQGIPVATTAPADSQVMTYSAALGQYVPKTGSGITAGMQAVKYATDFAWSVSPSGNLNAGAQTVSLAACPPGVMGTEPQYSVYVSGASVAEAALVTGGTCSGNGQPGTLQFTTVNSYAAGYSVGSASSGLQEALITARITPTNPTGASQAGKVIVPPGEINAYARISIRASDITVDFSGSIVNCWMNDSCIYVGSSDANAYSDITLISPRGRPTVVNSTHPFIEVNAQKTRIHNVSTRVAYNNGTFSSYVQVDGDQAFLLDGLDTSLGGSGTNDGVRCDATVCNPVISAPGPFGTNPAVGWLKNLNISLGCAGNGIDWQSGNTVRISDSVIQGYAQYGVRAGTKRGGYGGFEAQNVYEEVGACTNPAGNIGQAGVIAQGAWVKVEGGEGPAGTIPQFSNSGTTENHYYVVARNATYGPSNPLYAGKALTNGSGTITITAPDIAGATTFDLLRVTYSAVAMEQAPYGSGAYAVATAVSRSSACANGVCTFSDPQTALQAYTVAPGTYFPILDYWPASVLLAANQDTNSITAAARGWFQNVPSDLVAVQGMSAPAAIAMNCDSLAGWTPTWLSCYTAMAPSVFYQQGAMLMAVKPNADAGKATNLKGRLNFSTLGTGPGHIITLSDSNFQKTIATANNRPNNDATDAYIGYDQGNGDPTQIGISVGAPKAISEYIGNAGDGTSWLERLTANLKEFKANVQMDGTLTVAGSVQASSFVSTGTGPWTVQGNFGNLNPAASGQSLLGFGPNGALQVSQNGGALATVATLDASGNVAQNANTATQLAQTPTQCNGSFATGVQSNGNANCSTASVLQMAETTPPTGIPNYGIFWFDQTCHCARVIDNNGQPVQLGLTNVFNSDPQGDVADTVEIRNGNSAQALRAYHTYTDANNWERSGLGWDQTDGLMVLKSEAAGTGTVRGLGFWIGTGVKWAIDGAYNLKPFGDNTFSLGTPTLRPSTGYFGTAVYTPALLLQGTVNTSGGPVNLTGQTAAIGATSFLTSAPVGLYMVNVYVESDAACTTAGPAAVSVTLGWGDRTGARTMTVPLQGTGVAAGAVALGSTANFGEAAMTLWNNSASNNLTYATTYTACTTGTGTYAVYVSYRRVE